MSLTKFTGNPSDTNVTDRKALEEAWTEYMENRMRATSRFVGKGSIGTISGTADGVHAGLSTDESLLHLEREARTVCSLQSTMAQEVCRRIAEEDFETTWRSSSSAKREQVVLEGLYYTFNRNDHIDMADGRDWCPETTLKNLTSSDGETYLTLLKKLMPADLTVPLTEPIYISHPILDSLATPTQSELLHPGTKAYYRRFHINRSLTISLVAWHIFLAFYGLFESNMEYRAARPTRQSTKFSCPPDAREYMKKHIKDYKLHRKLLPNICWTCAKPAERLLACGKCRPIGRKVFYCSRDCQVTDWKSGMPKPHKDICGKPLSEDELGSQPKPTPDDCEKWMPKADPSFKRSPALLHQIHELKVAKSYDYLVVNYGKSTNVIRFPINSPEKQFFLVHRNRAFRNGNVQSVRALYTITCTWPCHTEFGLSRATFRKQLETEYGVAVPEEPIDVLSILPRFDTDEILFASESTRAQFPSLFELLDGV